MPQGHALGEMELGFPRAPAYLLTHLPERRTDRLPRDGRRVALA